MKQLGMFLAIAGGLTLGLVVAIAESTLIDLSRIRKIDILMRTIPGEPPPELSKVDPLMLVWRMVQWLGLGAMLIVIGIWLAVRAS